MNTQQLVLRSEQVLFLIALFFATNFNLSAQEILFNRTYALTNQWELTTGLVGSENGYFFSQHNLGPTIEDNQMFIGAIDSFGEVLWYKNFCADSTICTDSPGTLTKLDNNNLIVAGHFRPHIDSSGEAILFEFSSEGDSLELRMFGGDRYDYFQDIIVLPDSGFIICGESTSFSDNSDFYLVRLDQDKNVLWENTYGGSGWQAGISVDTSPDNGFIMCGKGGPVGGLKIIVIKTDSLGNLIWEKKFGGDSNNDGLHHVKTLQDGNFLVAATEGVGIVGRSDFLIKIDPNGNVIWEQSFSSGANTNYTTDILELSDGSIIVGGGKEVYVSEFDGYFWHSRMVKINPSGDLIWETEHHGNLGLPHKFWGIDTTSDGGLIAYGQSFGLPFGPATNLDGWVVKMDSEGQSCEELGCTLVDLEEVNQGQTKLVCFPNPINDYAYLDYWLPQTMKNIHMTIRNANGQAVFNYTEEQALASGSIRINTQDWPSGIYFVTLYSGLEILDQVKLIKQ